VASVCQDRLTIMADMERETCGLGIAAAQRFGQEDDISVISVTRTAGFDPAIA